MRYLYLAGAFLFFSVRADAQNARSVSVQEGSSLKNAVGNGELYTYPEFLPGRVFLKDGNQGSAPLNYNLLLGQMQFIDQKGDTLSLDNERTFKQIVIGVDTFFYDNQYLKLLTAAGTAKVAVNERIKIGDKQKTGAYGQKLSSSSVNSLSNITSGSHVTSLNVQQQVSLAKDRRFYIGDSNNRFLSLNKKNLLKVLPKQQAAVESYLAANPTDFTDEKSIRKLFAFMSQL